MSTRMVKYYEDEVPNSRVKKNEELYKEISKSEIQNYEVKSNTTVLGENNSEIDVEKIKKILDTKYKEIPKRRSFRIEEEETKVEEKKEDTTKEYDINVILEKAKEQKPDNYEEERLKKLRNTQFDILKNLNVKEEDNEEDDIDDNLKKLINTITINENIGKNNVKFNSKSNKEEQIKTTKENTTNTALDILSDLKGDDDTEVLEGLKEEVKDVLEDELEKDIEEKKQDEEKEKTIVDTKLEDSFYTSSNALKDRDFEDISDFSKDIESNNTFTKVVIFLIIVAVIVGIILFIKSSYFS